MLLAQRWRLAARKSDIIAPVKPHQAARPRHIDHLFDDHRGYPVIATVGRGEEGASFGSINERRKLALATFDWCAVCGLPLGNALRWQVLMGSEPVVADDRLDEELLFTEAPAHEICLIYAAHVCPHLSSPGHRLDDQLRAGQRRDSKIRMAGFRRTANVSVFRSELQQDVHVLHFAQAGLTDEFYYSRPEELADRYATLLECEQVPELSLAESGLIGLFSEHSDLGDTVCGAALMAGAAFAKDIPKVQGMEGFAASYFFQPLAFHLLDPGKIAEFGHRNDDPASKYMAGWLLERQRNLPAVLAGWRTAGSRFAKSHGVPRSVRGIDGDGRTVTKNAPCPCGSGRRARRCHPGGLPGSQR